MNSLLNWLVTYCTTNQIVSIDDEAWLRYGLEKRLTTLIVFIPFATLAIFLSGFLAASSYICSFFYLRSQTNGFHAKTHLGCLIGSLLLEFFFLSFIKPMLDSTGVICLISFSAIVVMVCAPYNHPMMDLSHKEYSACKRASRIRVMQLTFLCIALFYCGLLEIAKGISLGCAMASTLLVFAKIAERRIQYDSIADYGEYCSSFDDQKHD